MPDEQPINWDEVAQWVLKNAGSPQAENLQRNLTKDELPLYFSAINKNNPKLGTSGEVGRQDNNVLGIPPELVAIGANLPGSTAGGAMSAARNALSQGAKSFGHNHPFLTGSAITAASRMGLPPGIARDIGEMIGIGKMAGSPGSAADEVVGASHIPARGMPMSEAEYEAATGHPRGGSAPAAPEPLPTGPKGTSRNTFADEMRRGRNVQKGGNLTNPGPDFQGSPSAPTDRPTIDVSMPAESVVGEGIKPRNPLSPMPPERGGTMKDIYDRSMGGGVRVDMGKSGGVSRKIPPAPPGQSVDPEKAALRLRAAKQDTETALSGDKALNQLHSNRTLSSGEQGGVDDLEALLKAIHGENYTPVGNGDIKVNRRRP